MTGLRTNLEEAESRYQATVSQKKSLDLHLEEVGAANISLTKQKQNAEKQIVAYETENQA